MIRPLLALLATSCMATVACAQSAPQQSTSTVVATAAPIAARQIAIGFDGRGAGVYQKQEDARRATRGIKTGTANKPVVPTAMTAAAGRGTSTTPPGVVGPQMAAAAVAGAPVPATAVAAPPEPTNRLRSDNALRSDVVRSDAKPMNAPQQQVMNPQQPMTGNAPTVLPAPTNGAPVTQGALPAVPQHYTNSSNQPRR